MGNTGILKILKLGLKNITTGEFTGETKPNTPGDPDYVPPTVNLTVCPITYNYNCPIVSVTAIGVGTGEIEFGLEDSVWHNPALRKVKVIITSSEGDQNYVFTDITVNYFHHVFTGLEDNTTYTVNTQYLGVSDTVLHECDDLAEFLTPNADVITWEGTDPYCITDASCADGYAYNVDLNLCQLIESVSATPPSGGGGTPGTVVKVQSEQWNNGGAQLFEDGYPGTGDGTVERRYLDPHLWVNGNFQWDTLGRNTTDSRMNVAGIWCSPVPATFEWIGFSRKISLATAKTVIIGMAADNAFRFTLNGVDLVKVPDTGGGAGWITGGSNFNFWNLYRVNLPVGDNYIEMWAENFGSVAGMAAEIYDCTADELDAIANTTELETVILFSTKDLVGEPFDLGETVGYSCPSGWSLDTTGGIYTCKHITNATPTTANTGVKAFANRRRLLDGIPDGYSEANTESGGLGPYIEPVTDHTACPLPS